MSNISYEDNLINKVSRVGPSSGWKTWATLNPTFDSVVFPDSSIPSNYLPAQAFIMISYVNHCLLPWITVLDPFSTFMISGGVTGTLIGSLGGLDAVNNTLDIAFASGSFGYTSSGGRAPHTAFTIGNKILHHAYCRIDLQNLAGVFENNGAIATYFGVELMQNSRFRRVFLKYGFISGVEKTTNSINLTIDIPKDQAENLNYDKTIGSIKIYSKDLSESVALSVNEIKNGKLVCGSFDNATIIAAGNYYEFPSPIYIEDPYLLSGKFYGTETEATDGGFSDTNASGLDLYLTGDNSPYEEGLVLGCYAYGTVTTSETESGENGETEDKFNYLQFPSSSMTNTQNNKWAFIPFTDGNESEIYSNNTRYIENDDGGFDVALEGKIETYDKMLEDEAISFFRVEISTSGDLHRNNWHSKCLNNSVIKIESGSFKIINHIQSNVIDVSKFDLTGKIKFDVKGGSTYSIVNQYGWVINEHYDNGATSLSLKGAFFGKINSKSIVVSNLTNIMSFARTGLNFYDRYASTVTSGNGASTKFAFNKYQNWRVVINDTQYKIKDVKFQYKKSEDIPSDGEYSISFDIDDKDFVKNNSGSDGYLVFDEPYQNSIAMDSVSVVNGSTAYYDIEIGATQRGSGNLLSYSDSICLFGEYVSPTYKQRLDIGDRVGYCGGVYFGELPLVASSINASDFAIATPLDGGNGLSSFFHDLNSQDWAAYPDPEDGYIKYMKGALDLGQVPLEKTVIIQPKPWLIVSNSIDMLRSRDCEIMLVFTYDPIEFSGEGLVNNASPSDETDESGTQIDSTNIDSTQIDQTNLNSGTDLGSGTQLDSSTQL